MSSASLHNVLAALSLNTKQAVPAPSVLAAELIVDALFPSSPLNPGAAHYRLKAKGWLSPLLASEPGISLADLGVRTQALVEVSPAIKNELGGLSGRLNSLVQQSALEQIDF